MHQSGTGYAYTKASGSVPTNRKEAENETRRNAAIGHWMLKGKARMVCWMWLDMGNI